MCVVIDLDLVCLICLQPNKDMRRIFSADSDDPELEIAQKISILSDLKTNQSSRTLPSKICKSCLEDLKAAWRFRKNCQAALTIFQTIVKLDVKSENSNVKEFDEQQIKLPHGLQIKRVNVGNESDDGKKTKELIGESKVDDFISNNEKMDSSLYEELETNSQDKETNEFQATQDSNESDEKKEFENDEECFVEYYIAEEGAIDEQTENIDHKDSVRLVSKQAYEAEGHLKNTHKLSKRGRPKKQYVELQEPSKVRTKTEENIENITSSEDTTQPEVREVKTRKRKSHSLETKTPKICEICGNSYRYQHALKAHMRRHFNDKPFPCECCDKAFVSNVELRRHMRVHTGQKPYACQYCERRFSDFGSRIKHERTHTGERPYHCITCGKSFAYPHVLSVHLRTHTGEKRFRCDYCSKGFTKKAYLLSHVNQHHSDFHHDNNETIVKSENKLNRNNLEECDYTTELSNEIIDEDEEFDEESYEESGDIIITDSLMTPKIEADDATEIHQIMEDEPNEFTITVR